MKHKGAATPEIINRLVTEESDVFLRRITEDEAVSLLEIEYPWQVFATLIDESSGDTYLVLTEVQAHMIAKMFNQDRIERLNFEEGVRGRMNKRGIQEYKRRYEAPNSLSHLVFANF